MMIFCAKARTYGNEEAAFNVNAFAKQVNDYDLT
jgi:hypothetical protein